MKLELRSVSKTFQTRRGDTHALQDITLDVAAGEFVCLLGPSGCGKSTLLNIVAGLEKPDTGEVRMNARPVTEPGRDRVVIFQEAALFPWLNVRDNVAFGLAAVGVPRSERMAKADRIPAARSPGQFQKGVRPRAFRRDEAARGAGAGAGVGAGSAVDG